jgi:hypothetical protein
MKKKKVSDIKGVIKRERYYSTLAKKEGKYAEKKMKQEKKAGKPEMAKDSRHEAKLAFEFARKRKAIASKEGKKLRRPGADHPYGVNS